MDTKLCDPDMPDNIESIAKIFELGIKLKDDEGTSGSSCDSKGKKKARKLKDITNKVVAGKIGKGEGKKKAQKFVPHDVHQAKILQLLGVDLGAVDDIKKRKAGRARVDRLWIEKFCSLDWSEAFTEEGHLRLLRAISMLPRLGNTSDAHPSLWKAYRRFQVACMGLADYNERNQDAAYDLVKSITAQPAIYIKEAYRYSSHCNFLAKRKDIPESPAELFFTEVVYNHDVIDGCFLLEPRLYPPGITRPLEKAKFDRAQVIHPEGADCPSCNRVRRRFI